VTRVIEIKHVAAAQLVPILRPLVPPQGHMAAYPQSNMLIVSDRASNISRLVDIINRIDQPTSGEVEFVRLNYAAASDVVRVLNTLQQQSRKGDPQAAAPTLVADERTNSILLGGDKGDRLQLRAIIAHLDTPTETVGDTHVIYLRYAKAKDLVPVLTGVQTTQAKAAKGSVAGGAAPVPGAPPVVGGTAGVGSDIFNIQADESTNALVITAPPGVFRSLEAVIRQLDVRRAQVMVEAIIAEVSNDISAQLGVEWAALDRGGGNRPAAITNFGGGLAGALGSAATGGTSVPSVGSGLTMGLGRVVEDGMSFAAILRALKSDGSTNVLSTPSLVTLDNEEANIFVGDEVSIPTGSFTSTGTGGATPTNPFTTFNRQKVGIDLKVKPQISEGDTIKLEIEQTVDGIKSGVAGAESLVTNKRTVKTAVMVDNGKILVLGGLIKDDLIENNSRVPLLGDIPLLGALFRYKETKKVKTNLMVFLRPVVMRDAEAGLNLTNTKYDFIRSKQLEVREDGVGLISDDEAPVLPDFQQYLTAPSASEKKERAEPAVESMP
jgi:general secretion pathway protein D